MITSRPDGGELLAGAHEVRRGAAANQKANGADQDRLARSSFSGEDIQAGLELELELVDDGKMADGKKTKHGPEVQSYQMFDSA